MSFENVQLSFKKDQQNKPCLIMFNDCKTNQSLFFYGLIFSKSYCLNGKAVKVRSEIVYCKY